MDVSMNNHVGFGWEFYVFNTLMCNKMIVRGSSAQIQRGTIARGKIFVNIYLDIECQTATILYDLANEYYAKTKRIS